MQVEEPTGIYRRVNEIVRVAVPQQSGFTVVGPDGAELPWQKTSTGLLFPASVIPGELPVYEISCCSEKSKTFANEIVARKIGLHRLEIGNSRFRLIVDTAVPAIIEAYNLSAEEHHRLNFVETSPENPEALSHDIHSASDIPPAVPGVPGDNTGWTSLGGKGPMERVEILETGPLRGLVHLSRAEETWEFEWTAGSPTVIWRAGRGFRFLSISALPYLPFDRCVSGEEYSWPLGPEAIEPPDHDVGLRQWAKLPGGSMVYYNNGENYGALGIVALDGDLTWTGAGSRRFFAQKDSGETSIALTFPAWEGLRTVMNARRENGVLRHPLILKMLPANSRSAREVTKPLSEVPQYRVGRIAAVPAKFRPEALSLDGDWRLAYSNRGSEDRSDERTVQVPGSVHTQWYPGDPFSSPPPKYYTHEADWISSKDWWYRKTFHIPENFAGKRLRLQFDATDYYADAFLNGHRLGRHEGYIDPYEYDVTKAAKPGADNELTVRIWTPVTYYWRHRPYTIKGSYGAVDQKPDDITAEGITRPVRLLASEAANIGDISVDTRLLDDKGDRAEVEIGLAADGGIEGTSWEIILSPKTFPSPDVYRVTAPGSVRTVMIPVEHPHLWWTWDHGSPDLYTLDVRLLDAGGRVIDGKSMAIGIREIEKQGWDFYLNRRRMFIRGTNYYYNLFLSEMKLPGYEKDMTLMREMNVNMIRLHTHFSNPEFYDLADEKGILVWQDFLESWYPHDKDFAVRAASLYDPLIRYVRNHPSIAIWAASDEEDLENYRVITKHLAPRPAFLDPQHRPVIRSTGRFGDAHVYHGWYDGSVWEYTSMSEPFVSELGATALPNYGTIMKFLPNGWPIQDHQQEWIFHKLQIPEAMRAWGSPGRMTLQEYIPRTQAYVSRLFQLSLERSRRLKYNPAGGILHFHAIDIWPSATMAAVDFYREPTKAFYTVQRSFSPVLASLEYTQDRWRAGEEVRCGVWAINDRWDKIPNARIRWRILDSRKASRLDGVFETTMESDSSHKLGEVRWTADKAGSYELHAEVLDASGKQLSENIFEFEIQ